jgi:S1-C subfamily serine protease
VIEDILATGQPNQPPRPWLGLYATDMDNKVVVMGVADRGPAKAANLQAGDVVLSVNGAPVVELASFYKKLWALGPVGTKAQLGILRNGRTLEISVVSADRNRIAQNPKLH